MKRAIILAFVVGIIAGCTRSHLIQDGPKLVPNTFFFTFSRKGVPWSDSEMRQSKLTYMLQGKLDTCHDFRAADTTVIPFFRYVAEMYYEGITSADSNVKQFYLVHPDNTQDTLTLDYRHIDLATAANQSCFCTYPLVSVMYEGAPVPNTSILGAVIYRFNK